MIVPLYVREPDAEAAPRPQPLEPALTAFVRRMQGADLPAVMEVARASLPQPWSEPVWREELASVFGLYLVLQQGSDVSGFVGVKRVADEAHVMTLAVPPGSRRRGLGRALVRAALADAALAGVRRVHWRCGPPTKPLRALYASLGFRETGRRKNYYGDEDALLMTLDLS
jgi:ribosomal-protein-alanine N-acetyltransferase